MIAGEARHCTHCGSPWPDLAREWPRVCNTCRTTTWRNARPVIIVILLTEDPHTGVEHVLLGVRAIPPQVGHPALFSGFIEQMSNEPQPLAWQQEAAREVWEETSGLILLDPKSIQPHHAFPFDTSHSVPGIFMAFCVARIPWPSLANWTPNEETSQLLLAPLHDIGVHTHLAFPTHEAAIQALLTGSAADRRHGR